MNSSRLCFTAVIAAMAVTTLFGCSDPNVEPSVRADAEVRLPDPPDFQEKPPARRYPDGAYSVLTLMEAADRSIGKEVTVRGLVADTVLCTDGQESEPRQKAQQGRAEKRALEKQEEACHPPSHLYLADDVNDEGSRLLIIGWSPNKVRGVRRGQELTFRGTFGRVSEGGVFIRQAGLLSVAP